MFFEVQDEQYRWRNETNYIYLYLFCDAITQLE